LELPAKEITPVTTTAATRDEARTAESELPALMIRYQRGEAAAIEELVRRLSPALLRFFSFSQVSMTEAEDLLQDCWLRIHRSRETYRASEPVLPWIFAIARYTRLDGHRRRHRRTSREVLVADPPDFAPTLPETRGDGSDELMNMLGQIPESQREVILMLKVSGMSLEEVARATSSSVGAIKQKAHRAYAKLRELLTKEQ
jgi:RNA polymerase sigma-70 factor (ECF subfamily)